MYVLAVMNNFFDTLFSYQNGNLFLNFIFLYNMFGYLISFSVEIIPYPVCKNRLKSFRPYRELFVKETHTYKISGRRRKNVHSYRWGGQATHQVRTDKEQGPQST